MKWHVLGCVLLLGACGGSDAPPAAQPAESSGDEYDDVEAAGEDDAPEEPRDVRPEQASFDRDPPPRSACRGGDCPIDTDLWLEQHGIEEPMPIAENLPTDAQAYDAGCRAILYGESGREGLRCSTSNQIGRAWEQHYETLLVADGTFMRIVWTGPTAAFSTQAGERPLPAARLVRTFEADGNTFTLADPNCAVSRAAVDSLTDEDRGGAPAVRIRRAFDQVCGAAGRYTLARGSFRRAARLP